VLRDDGSGNGEHPSGEGSRVFVAETGEAAPDGQEDVLQRILGVLCPSQPDLSVPVDPGAIGIEQTSERIDVTSPGPLDQALQGELVRRLCPLYRGNEPFPYAHASTVLSGIGAGGAEDEVVRQDRAHE
jgi:hypothetical protein